MLRLLIIVTMASCMAAGYRIAWEVSKHMNPPGEPERWFFTFLFGSVGGAALFGILAAVWGIYGDIEDAMRQPPAKAAEGETASDEE